MQIVISIKVIFNNNFFSFKAQLCLFYNIENEIFRLRNTAI